MEFEMKEINKDNFLSHPNEIRRIAELTFSFEDTYKDVKTWFWQKVVPGLSTGERTVIYILERRKIVAFTILKDAPQEKKICTLYITPDARGRGLASLLFEESFLRLRTATPVISVPEDRLKHFKKYLIKYSFHTSGCRFLGSKKLREFVYNE